MNRIFFSIGPITIYWYSFFIIVAIFLGYEIVCYYSKKTNFCYSVVLGMLFPLVVSAIIGAKSSFNQKCATIN